jgi:hypothetical protein
MRTPEGQIVDQSPTLTSTPPSTPEESTPTSPKETTKSEAKSLLNEETPEPKGAPEKYENFKVPEGFTLDEAFTKDASTLFKKLDLNQVGAQELVDLHTKVVKEAYEANEAIKANERLKWRDEINADPEIGGSKLRNTKISIGRLIDMFGSAKVAEGFRKAMDSTGAGDNPDVIRGLYALSKHLTEGGVVRGNGPSVEGQRVNGTAQPSTAQAMYPHLPSNRG